MSEFKVAEDLSLKGWSLISKNTFIAGVEVDLVFKKKSFLMVEVKTLRSSEEISFRLSFSQKKRLLFARQCLEDYQNQDVELLIAYVLSDKIIYVPIEGH